MEKIAAALKIVLADSFVLYFKAQSYHWNVEGMLFSQYHDFFGGIYEEVYGSIDTTAEHIRILGDYAPISLEELYKYKTIQEDSVKPTDVSSMLSSLQNDNNKLIDNLNKLFEIANAENEQGLADYVASRIDAHKKHAWMIRSSLKKTGE